MKEKRIRREVMKRDGWVSLGHEGLDSDLRSHGLEGRSVTRIIAVGWPRERS